MIILFNKEVANCRRTCRKLTSRGVARAKVRHSPLEKALAAKENIKKPLMYRKVKATVFAADSPGTLPGTVSSQKGKVKVALIPMDHLLSCPKAELTIFNLMQYQFSYRVARRNESWMPMSNQLGASGRPTQVSLKEVLLREHTLNNHKVSCRHLQWFSRSKVNLGMIQKIPLQTYHMH